MIELDMHLFGNYSMANAVLLKHGVLSSDGGLARWTCTPTWWAACC